MLETIFISLTAFAGTNIDDLLINMFFFSDTQNSSEFRGLTIGKYLGMGTLTVLSILSALGLQLLRFQYLSLLGIIPVLLGIKEIIQNIRSKEDDESPAKHTHAQWLTLMLVTIANGADNLGVYIPLFSGFVPWQLLAAVCVFAIMTGLSCLLAAKLSRIAVLVRFLKRWRKAIIPVVYILLGLYIIY